MGNGILKIIPVAQSIALAGHSVKFAKKKDKDALDFVGQGMESIVGASMISETAKITGSF